MSTMTAPPVRPVRPRPYADTDRSMGEFRIEAELCTYRQLQPDGKNPFLCLAVPDDEVQTDLGLVYIDYPKIGPLNGSPVEREGFEIPVSALPEFVHALATSAERLLGMLHRAGRRFDDWEPEAEPANSEPEPAAMKTALAPVVPTLAECLETNDREPDMASCELRTIQEVGPVRSGIEHLELEAYVAGPHLYEDDPVVCVNLPHHFTIHFPVSRLTHVGEAMASITRNFTAALARVQLGKAGTPNE
jgi:hypothetical protein